MFRLSARRVQPFVCLITTFALALLFASCDQAGLAPTPEAPVGGSPETLTFAPMPNGATLLEPGASPAAKQSGASPYGCYLASRPYTDEVRFRSVYLHFPEDVVEAANGETEPLIRRVSASQDGSVPGEKDVRYMNCMIPKTPDARELVTEQLLRAGMYEAAEAALQEENASSASKDDGVCYTIVTYHYTCVGSVSNPYDSCSLDWVEEGQSCLGSSTEINIEWPDGSGGGSSGGGSGGSGSCMEINPPPGSDCAQDQESTETKLFKMAGRLIKLIDDGGDLLKVSTWKKLGQEQWADVVGCAASISSATTTLNAWSLIEVMDCAASIYFGISGGNILSAFKTVGLFDDMIEIVAQSNRFGDFVSTLPSLKNTSLYGEILSGIKNSTAAGKFGDLIDDLDLLYDYSKLGQESGDSYRVYRIMEGSAGEVFDNFVNKWGDEGLNVISNRHKVLEYGDNTLTLYESSTEALPTIRVGGPFGPSNSWREIRFGSW